MAAILAIDAEREAPLLDREREPIGAGIAVVMRPPRREMIAFEQIVDRDPALLLDIRAAPQDGTLVELHVDDPRIGHAVAYRRAGEGNQSVPHNPQRARLILALRRSEERRVGQECFSTCRSGWSQFN